MAASYKDLVVWQKSMDLTKSVYLLTAMFPEVEKYGLANQLRRAAVSVASNIAEGQGRLTKGEFKQFLGVARGSLYELETQILIAQGLEYLPAENLEGLLKAVQEVNNMLNGLLKSLSKEQPRSC